jgi:chromatin structure-remodeling complex protein RSC7
MDGVYDIHTNVMHYPKIMQPTHVKWEESSQHSDISHVNDHIANGLARLTNGVQQVSLDDKSADESIFDRVPSVVTRNFLVTDTILEMPPTAGLSIPGPGSDALDVGANGLPKVDEETLTLLPPDCRTALLGAKEKEVEWKERWKSESEDGHRGRLRISYLGYPN